MPATGLRAAAAVVAALALAGGCGRRQAPSTAKPLTDRVVLVTIDTLRADHVGARREGVALTPFLDAFAAQAVSFDDAVANVTLTRPSHASMLTGVYPWRHGVSSNTAEFARDVVTLGERLQPRGIAAAAIVSSTPMRGLWRGFGTFLEPLESPDRYEAPPELITRTARDWMARHRSERFFLMVHYLPPHGPYTPPRSFRLPREPREGRRLRVVPDPYEPETIPAFQQLGDERDPGVYRARYAAHVRYVDSQIGALMDALRELGLYEKTAIIVTADHGESLGEHGLYFSHGNAVYDEQTAVPLLLKLPGAGKGGRRSRAPVEGVDLFPTVLELLGEPVPKDVDGRSLLGVLAPGAQAKPLRFVQSAEGPPFTRTTEGAQVAVLATPWKLVTRSGELKAASAPPRFALFRVDRDAGDRSDLAREQPALAGQLFEEIRRRFRPFPAPQPISPETERELRALGYVR